MPKLGDARILRTLPSRMSGVTWLSGLLAVGVAGVVGGVVGGAADATTGDNANLPDPGSTVAAEIGDAYIGRFYLARVPRAARIVAGRLDFSVITEEFPNFFFGELELRFYEKSGRTTITVVNTYPWEFAKSTSNRKVSGTLYCGLVPSTSVNREHPRGVSIGHLSLTVPAAVHEGTGTGQKVVEQSKVTAKLTFAGHTSTVQFQRESDQETPTKLRKAKIVG